MSDQIRLAFLRDIASRPADDAPRLVFADWLCDNGDPHRARMIRAQTERWRLVHDNEDIASIGQRLDDLDRLAGELLRLYGEDWTLSDANVAGINGIRQYHVDYNRGFPSGIRIDFSLWEAHHELLLSIWPLDRVCLLGTLPPLEEFTVKHNERDRTVETTVCVRLDRVQYMRKYVVPSREDWRVMMMERLGQGSWNFYLEALSARWPGIQFTGE